MDAGYINGSGCLVPYGAMWYHFNEWIRRTPTNYKELFNFQQSSVKNCIEGTFVSLKKC